MTCVGLWVVCLLIAFAIFVTAAVVMERMNLDTSEPMKLVFEKFQDLNNTHVFDPSDFMMDRFESKMVQIQDEI